MAVTNGVYETATGDLLRAGNVDFSTDGAFDSNTETIHTDVPVPSQVRGSPDFDTYHRWTGTAWILVPNIRSGSSTIELVNQSNTGRVEFGGMSRLSGLDLRVEAGNGIIKTGPPNDDISATTSISWVQTDITLSANSELFIGVDSTGTITTSITPFDAEKFIILGSAITSLTYIEFLSHVDIDVIQPIPDLHRYLSSAVGPIAISGLLVSIDGTSPLQFTVDSGVYYIAKDRKTSSIISPAIFTYWYGTSGGGPPLHTAVPSQAEIDSTNYDDGFGLAAMPLGKWKKDLIFLAPVSNGTSEIHIVYGQEVFDTQEEAKLGNIPTPPSLFSSDAIRLAGVVVQEGATEITTIVQLQPKLGQFAPPSTTITEHGGLIGLGDNDHPQYQLRSEKSSANGYASLGPSAVVPNSELPAATESDQGAAEIATQSETDTGTDNARIVTPLKLATTPRLPSQDENNALQGTNGTPSDSNRYVTNTDPRNNDSRTPTGAAGGELSGTYPNPTVNDGADGSAIHDDTAGEIAAVTEKTAPVGADIVLIEDSAAANAKKRSSVNNLRGLVRTEFSEITADTTTTATLTSPATLLSINITPVKSTNRFIVDLTASADTNDGSDGAISFQLWYGLTGSETKRRSTFIFNDSANHESGSCALKMRLNTLGAGQHTFQIRWGTDTGGTARIRPVSFPNHDHCSLLVQEISV